MTRSRSRSPKRDRRRSRSRERKPRRSRSRSPTRRRRSRTPPPRRRLSRSPERRFGRSESPEEQGKGKKNMPNPQQLAQRPQLDASAFIGKSEEEVQMMTVMGFGGFDTTKGKHVPGNDVSEINIVEKRRYRQYMNRRGGFNRPLDPIA